MSQHTPLLDLPPELRNLIYNAVLVREVTLISASTTWTGVPALLQTCRQIRREASPLYWTNDFRIQTSSLNATERAQHLLSNTPLELLTRIPRIYVEPRINPSRSMTGLIPKSGESPIDWWRLGAIARQRGLRLSKFVFESRKLMALREQLRRRPGWWALRDVIGAEEGYVEGRERAFVLGIAGRSEEWLAGCELEWCWVG